MTADATTAEADAETRAQQLSDQIAELRTALDATLREAAPPGRPAGSPPNVSFPRPSAASTVSADPRAISRREAQSPGIKLNRRDRFRPLRIRPQ